MWRAASLIFIKSEVVNSLLLLDIVMLLMLGDTWSCILFCNSYQSQSQHQIRRSDSPTILQTRLCLAPCPYSLWSSRRPPHWCFPTTSVRDPNLRFPPPPPLGDCFKPKLNTGIQMGLLQNHVLSRPWQRSRFEIKELRKKKKKKWKNEREE